MTRRTILAVDSAGQFGVTKVGWTYTFAGRGWLSARFLAVFARFLWSGYMRVCMFNVQRHFAAIARPAGRPLPQESVDHTNPQPRAL